MSETTNDQTDTASPAACADPTHRSLLLGLYAYQRAALLAAHAMLERVQEDVAKDRFPDPELTPAGAAAWAVERVGEELMGLVIEADRAVIEQGGATALTPEQVAYMRDLGDRGSTPEEIRRWLRQPQMALATFRAVVPPPPDTAAAPTDEPWASESHADLLKRLRGAYNVIDGLQASLAELRAPAPATAATPDAMTAALRVYPSAPATTVIQCEHGYPLCPQGCRRIPEDIAAADAKAGPTDEAPTDATTTDAHDAARYRFLRDNPLQLRAIDGAAAFWGNTPAEHIDRWTDAAMENAGAPTPTED